MKKIIFSSLIVVLMLGSCQNESKKDSVKTDTIADVEPPPPVVGSKDSMEAPPPPVANPDQTVYDFVKLTHPPTYPGGMEKFYEFIGKNITYPPLALKNKVQGNVFLNFTIEKDGSITDIKVLRKLGSGTDEEAVRVIKLSKRWNPGTENGKPVRVSYNIPVKFSLEK